MYNALNDLYRSIDSFNCRYDYNTFKQIKGLGNLYESRLNKKFKNISSIPSIDKLNERFALLVHENKDNEEYLNELFDIQERNNLGLRHLFDTRYVNRDNRNNIHIQNNFIPQKKDIKKLSLENIASDNQNVHNTYINESTKKAAIFITDKYKIKNNKEIDKIIEEIISEMKIKYKDFYLLIDEYKKYNGTTFGIGINLMHLLCSVWKCIKDQPEVEDLKERLYQEMSDSSRHCSSGKLTRLLNTLQGYNILDDIFNVTVYVQNFIFDYINKKIQQYDDYIEGLILTNPKNKEEQDIRDKTLKFVNDIVESNIKEWSEKFEIEEKEIIDIKNKYLNL